MKRLSALWLLVFLFANQNMCKEQKKDYKNSVYIGDSKLDSVYKENENVNQKLSDLLQHWAQKIGIDPDSIELYFHTKPQDREAIQKNILSLSKQEFDSPKAKQIVKRIFILELYKKLLATHVGKEGKKGTGRMAVLTPQFMGLVYSPGVGYVSKYLSEAPQEEFEKFVKTKYYTYNANQEKKLEGPSKDGVNMYTVTDGSATLGIGNVGEASLPVMFGKAELLAAFGGTVKSGICYVDTQAYWKEKNYDKIINTVVDACREIKKRNPHTVIMLEDIAAPVCFEIEKQLNKEGIFTIHDDQWGTAIIFSAGVINATELAGKNLKDLKIVMSGAGASAVAVARTLKALGVKHLIAYDSKGAIYKNRNNLTPEKKELAAMNQNNFDGNIEDALHAADGFIGLSSPGLFKGREVEMLQNMNPGSFVFAVANPDPEFDMHTLEKHKHDILKVVAYFGCGAFGHPGTTINNSSAFPGVYKALTDAVTEKKLKPAQEIDLRELAVASAKGLASKATQKDLGEGSVVPRTFTEEHGYNFKVTKAVAINVWQLVTGETEKQATEKYKNLEKELKENQNKTITAFKKISKKGKQFVRSLIELLGEEDFPIMKKLKKAVNAKRSKKLSKTR